MDVVVQLKNIERIRVEFEDDEKGNPEVKEIVKRYEEGEIKEAYMIDERPICEVVRHLQSSEEKGFIFPVLHLQCVYVASCQISSDERIIIYPTIQALNITNQLDFSETQTFGCHDKILILPAIQEPVTHTIE